MRVLNLSLALRDYQVDAINTLARNYGQGIKRQILAMPTGSGKTETAAGIFQRVIEAGIMPPRTVPYFIVDRTVLCQQAAERFERMGFNVGIVQGDNTTPRQGNEDVIVASVQSIRARYKARPVPDDMGMAIIDEAHIIHRRHAQIIKTLDNILVVGLSATPLREGLGRLFQGVVKGPTIAECIARGWLVPFRCFGPQKPNLDGVEVTGGDYNQRQLGQRMQTITGDIVSSWKALGENRQTIVFAVDIAHAGDIAEDFRAEGIAAAVIHHKTPPDDVADVFGRFESGELRILCSVTKLSTGFDSPIASCAIMARPTLSEALFMQMAGRVCRPYPGKQAALLLDHAGNVERFGRPDDFWVPDSLDDGELASRNARKRCELPEMRTCPECTYMVPRAERECPECGLTMGKPNVVVVKDGELVDLDSSADPANKSRCDEALSRKQFYAELLGFARERGYKRGWAWHKYHTRYGERPAFGSAKPLEPSLATRRWIKSRQIAHARARKL